MLLEAIVEALGVEALGVDGLNRVDRRFSRITPPVRWAVAKVPRLLQSQWYRNRE